MPNHKFLATVFNHEYQTQNAILSTIPFTPRVLIVGTFNPDVPNNPADFFYGRNYFWRIFENFSNNNNLLNGPRITENGNIREPDIERVFYLCKQFKMTFADLVTGTHEGVELQGFRDDELNALGKAGLLYGNVNNIAAYINNTRSIDFVFLTRQLTGDNYLSNLWHDLQHAVDRPVIFSSIFTPSGQGLGGLSPGAINKAHSMAREWVWVNHVAPPTHIPLVTRLGFGHFDHHWLAESGVDINGY